MRITSIERMLFALLKSSLLETPAETIPFMETTDNDWKKCYKLAAEQGVMAVAWEGIQTLPSNLQPPRGLKLTWGLAVQQYEEKYNRYCQTAAELSNYYAQHQIAMVQMKGVGFSIHYTIPSHREGGDIDIYTYSADKSKRNDKEANRLADELMRQQDIDVDMHSPKHSNFYYKGIPIENHKTFLNVETYPVAVQMNNVLHQCLQPVLTPLLEGKYQIYTPSPAFNALFISFHAAQHFGSGLALHHLYDWASLLKTHGWCLPGEVTDKRLLRFIHALTDMSHALLGTTIVKGANEVMMDKIYEEILHPRYSDKNIPKDKWGILVYKTKRLFYTFSLKDEVLKGSLAQRLWTSIVTHIREPHTIFNTGDK